MERPGDKLSEISYTVLSDESGVRERFLAFGAILLPTRHVRQVESELQTFCAGCGMGSRELGWKKCSATDVERYCEFVEKFWRLNRGSIRIDFRAMVVDTHQHPLEHPESGADTRELGFYRFYYTFLSRSVRCVAPGVDPDATFLRTFTTPGTYGYFCIPHEGAKMKGTLVVLPRR